MRLSTEKRAAVVDLQRGSSLVEFVARVALETTELDRTGGVFLIGGTSPLDLAVAGAQSALRLDRLASYWSHAALAVSWPQDATPGTILGMEASLAPEVAAHRVPERNGVTLFHLSRYEDERQYPNMAFATLCAVNAEAEPDVRELKKRMVDAAAHPNAERLRYRLWDWLGLWTAYAFSPDQHPNPLGSSVPLPSAAFCEYAYESAGVDLTPGATEPNTCPELLWSTFLYWHERLQDSRGIGDNTCILKVWSVIRSAGPLTRQPLGESLEDDLPPSSQEPTIAPDE